MQTHIRVAASALVVRDGHALLAEFEDVTGRHFNFPGGGVELGESLEEAVRREVLEETALAVDVERLLLIVESTGPHNVNWSDSDQAYVPWNEVRFFFLARPFNEDRDDARLPDVPDADQIGVCWMPFEQLARLPIFPAISAQLLAALHDHVPPTIIPCPSR